MPIDCARFKITCAAGTSSMNALSVISSFRFDGESPVCCRMPSISFIRSASENCRLDTFTQTTRGAAAPNCFCQTAICRQDSASIRRPMSRIRPVVFGDADEFAGGTNPAPWMAPTRKRLERR